MKLLVTGGAGFIGSNFIRHWMTAHPEDSIVNFDVLTYAGNLENIADISTLPNYSFVRGDITDKEAVRKALTGIDTLVHFAAESHVDRSIQDPGIFVRTNVMGTHVLLEEALKANVKRFHHVSTDEVFGSLELGSESKFSESTPYDPRSPYSASKASSDHLVRAYYHTFGLPITISNCSNNYGPYQFPEKFIPLAIINALNGVSIPLYGDGANVRDWLYVEDHCRALERILIDGRIGETYCVGGGTQELSNKDIVTKILTVMKKDLALIQHVSDRPGHDRRYAIDASKLTSELGWEPKHDFDAWLQQTITWYTEHKEWWSHITSGEYKAYYEKQYGRAA